MKKSLLFSSLAFCALSVFAQDAVVLPTSATFAPDGEDGAILPSTNTTITVVFNETPSVPATAMLITGNGFGMEMKMITQKEASQTFTIDLTQKDWGVPYNEWYYMQMAVTFMNGEDYYYGPDREPVVFQAMYMTEDTGDARLELTFPNQQNINNEEYTLAQAYQSGTGTLYFSKVVNTLGASGSLSVFDANGDDLVFPIDIEIEDGEWSDMDGLFVVNFTFDPEDIDVNEISKMEYSFEGFTAEGKNIDVDSVILTQKSSRKVARKNDKSQIASEIEVSNEGFSVFNLQGVLVKENATNADVNKLPKGLYIANGKKIVVK